MIVAHAFDHWDLFHDLHTDNHRAHVCPGIQAASGVITTGLFYKNIYTVSYSYPCVIFTFELCARYI